MVAEIAHAMVLKKTLSLLLRSRADVIMQPLSLC